ncbi:transposase [Streptomyces albidoflavus]
MCRLDGRAGPPARGRGPKRGLWKGEALGRSRGGLSTKIHLACDGQGRPLAFTITGRNVHGCTQFAPVMARIGVKRDGPGRPRTRPDRVAGDKGYSSRKIRAYLRRRGIVCVIPERTDQLNGRRRRGETLCRLPTPQRRRTLLQPAQAEQSPRHSLRPTSPPLPSPGHPHLPTALAPH